MRSCRRYQFYMLAALLFCSAGKVLSVPRRDLENQKISEVDGAGNLVAAKRESLSEEQAEDASEAEDDIVEVDPRQSLQRPIAEHCGKGLHHQRHRTIYQRLVKRIVGGQESFDGEWPWLVTMRLLRNGSFEHLCGGTLISARWVITAAHCFESVWADYLTDDVNRWMARIGEHNMFVDQASHIDVSVEKIFLHPNRKAPELLNMDIALVKLSQAVSFNDRVNVACLPRDNEEFRVGTKCVTAGWGHTKEDGNVSYIVQHVYVPIISNDVCDGLYSVLAPKIHMTISDDMMCAGFEEGGQDACQYDSGGPMVCFDANDDQWLLAGIVSTGYGCARPGFPGIYTRVNKFMSWIDDITATN